MEEKQEKALAMWPAIVKAKCPKCRVGDIYTSPLYSLSGQKMHINCPHCGMTYEREPGYFYGAMYVSYAFIVAELVALAIGTSIITGSDNPWLYIIVLLGVVGLLAPFNMRYSRVILLHWLTPGLHYHPDLSAGH
ncbi:DUF983 domain-containing protein [Mucilaginibacter rubeus]|uniref:DUF983 domain-containing protein n=1 Tax=Mucilaginibacter rubeus TaxID=2027860 RepID=A0AAE6JHW6_9SPHI|nr:MULTISPECIES: DUF983 domain-containing protein [Mucilaginibacter]QEM05997.1 DUF983 domain-containing protein [Mucilaginibacter rubeus]QEM18578.1 DUF983 domain-containing protein [Mucilaginibacter gossypii]QTE44879.1 DUF983 domain-containing protein [Mucilaginibacter rubeus]QTE51477.1 DUF983 domain-containing protein [Mucilaginibacter rubeus]QTE56563.1 DUF983 domain-containing protein [Mucilaginibacter rubeus]